MRARVVFIFLLILVCSVSAQQSQPAGAGPRTVPGGVPGGVPPGIGGAPPGVPAPSPADAVKIAEVMAFEKKCDDAAVQGDVAFLERALSSDFVMTHGDGWTSGGAPLKVDTKQTWIAYVGKQPLPYVYRNLDSIQVEERQIGGAREVGCDREHRHERERRTVAQSATGISNIRPPGLEPRPSPHLEASLLSRRHVPERPAGG